MLIFHRKIVFAEFSFSSTLQPSPYSSDYGIYPETVSTSGLHYYNNANGSSYDYNQFNQNPYSSHFPSNINNSSSHSTEIFNNVQSVDINSSNGKTNHFNCNLMEAAPPVNNASVEHVRGLVKVIQTNKIKEEMISSKIFSLIQSDKYNLLKNCDCRRT